MGVVTRDWFDMEWPYKRESTRRNRSLGGIHGIGRLQI